MLHPLTRGLALIAFRPRISSANLGVRHCGDAPRSSPSGPYSRSLSSAHSFSASVLTETQKAWNTLLGFLFLSCCLPDKCPWTWAPSLISRGLCFYKCWSPCLQFTVKIQTKCTKPVWQRHTLGGMPCTEGDHRGHSPANSSVLLQWLLCLPTRTASPTANPAHPKTFLRSLFNEYLTPPARPGPTWAANSKGDSVAHFRYLL